ncbi:MAG TPA: PIN domain-containing protein [Thermoanaerobaculia bacterium]|nr:PIN domain-containing protein [Thermoanaerobaculia bacterium]
MSAEGPEFVDTNVFVYAFDQGSGAKGEKARALVRRLWEDGRGCLSLQVLQELYVTLTRKVARPVAPEAAARIVEDLAAWRCHEPSRTDLADAIELCRKSRISLWDALVLQSARRTGCAVLWSEDLNAGQKLAGVQVRNPFV